MARVCAFLHLSVFPSIPEVTVGFLGEESTKSVPSHGVTFSPSHELVQIRPMLLALTIQ